jgi:hypothetical protein
VKPRIQRLIELSQRDMHAGGGRRDGLGKWYRARRIATVIETGYPCRLCGVRPDVNCRHRAGITAVVILWEPKPDGRKTRHQTDKAKVPPGKVRAKGKAAKTAKSKKGLPKPKPKPKGKAK